MSPDKETVETRLGRIEEQNKSILHSLDQLRKQREVTIKEGCTPLQLTRQDLEHHLENHTENKSNIYVTILVLCNIVLAIGTLYMAVKGA